MKNFNIKNTTSFQAALISIFVICVYFTFDACIKKEIDFIGKNIESRGGNKALDKVKSKKISGKFIIRQDKEFPFIIYTKRPDKIRIESGELISATDGKSNWWINPQVKIYKPAEMPESDASRLRDMYRFHWGYLQTVNGEGYGFEFLGKEIIDDNALYILKLSKNGKKHNLYLDAANYLEKKLVGKLEPYDVKAETVFLNYKHVDDILAAHQFDFIVNGNKDVSTIIDKIELNPDINDSYFKMPLTLDLENIY